MQVAHVQLVRSTFEQLRPQLEAVAAMIYDRLFAIDPTTPPLFHGDQHKQHLMLMSSFDLAIANLDRPEILQPLVQGMGTRHVGYGVTSAQYTSLGEALQWTLECSLGADFTPEVQDAWLALYDLLARMMQAAAAGTAGGNTLHTPEHA